jgi:hypothetical protein
MHLVPAFIEDHSLVKLKVELLGVDRDLCTGALNSITLYTRLDKRLEQVTRWLAIAS